MLTRIISGIVLLTLALFATFYSSTSFTIFIITTMCIALYEAIKLLSDNKKKLLGIIYIALGCFSLIILRELSILYALLPFAIVWSCDSAAYFVGVTFGKHKMAPKISPKKSWEGTIGGVLTGTIIGTLLLINIIPVNLLLAVIICLNCSILAVLGDLLESAVKRISGVKDSGNLIPGHGGVLDRIDSLLPASLWILICVLILKLL